MEKLLHQLASKQTIVVNVYDTTNKAEPINMYGTNVTDTGLLHISTLDFGDPTRKHEMHCRLGFAVLLAYRYTLRHRRILIFFFSSLVNTIFFGFTFRFKQRAPPPWTAITASVGVLVITLLLGHIFRAAITRIAEAELGYQNMRVLMHRAEAADKAKSQVHSSSTPG